MIQDQLRLSEKKEIMREKAKTLALLLPLPGALPEDLRQPAENLLLPPPTLHKAQYIHLRDPTVRKPAHPRKVRILLLGKDRDKPKLVIAVKKAKLRGQDLQLLADIFSLPDHTKPKLSQVQNQRLMEDHRKFPLDLLRLPFKSFRIPPERIELQSDGKIRRRLTAADAHREEILLRYASLINPAVILPHHPLYRFERRVIPAKYLKILLIRKVNSLSAVEKISLIELPSLLILFPAFPSSGKIPGDRQSRCHKRHRK